VAPGTFVQPRGPLVDPLGGPAVACLQPLGLGVHEGVGVLRETAGHRLGQAQVIRRAPQHRLRQLEVERARVACQQHVVFLGLALAGEFVGHAAHQHQAGRTGAQQAGQQEQAQQTQEGTGQGITIGVGGDAAAAHEPGNLVTPRESLVTGAAVLKSDAHPIRAGTSAAA
jgi:hypothetical protein